MRLKEHHVYRLTDRWHYYVVSDVEGMRYDRDEKTHSIKYIKSFDTHAQATKAARALNVAGHVL